MLGAKSGDVSAAHERCCTIPVGAVARRDVRAIEGLSSDAPERHAVQEARIAARVPQCGYCQPGMIMAAAAQIAENPRPTDAEIDEAITNLCRCGTYPRVRGDPRGGGGNGMRRHTFLLGASAGPLVVGFRGWADSIERHTALLTADADGPLFAGWIKIAPDDTVTVYVPYVDMGQGTHAALAMLATEELDAD